MDTTINASGGIYISGAINPGFYSMAGFEDSNTPSRANQIDKVLVDATIEEELGKRSERVGAERYKSGRFADAARMLRTLVHGETFVEFLTLPAYDALIAEGA